MAMALSDGLNEPISYGMICTCAVSAGHDGARWSDVHLVHGGVEGQAVGDVAPGPPEGAVGGLTRHHYMCADEIMPMMEVEAALCQSSMLAEHCINAKSDLMQCAMFHCVCTQVLVVVRLATPPPASITEAVAGVGS